MRVFLALMLIVPIAFAAPRGPAELPAARVGDVILLPLKCMLCTAITQETGSDYSHSGVLVRSPQGEWKVAEALGSVRLVPLGDFLKRTAAGKTPGLFRHRLLAERPAMARRLWGIFQEQFAGGEFDHLFLWGNQAADGRELLYCSEFVAKFISSVLPAPIGPVPMDFSRNAAFWKNYFSAHGGSVPQGQLGMAPADLERSADFLPVE